MEIKDNAQRSKCVEFGPDGRIAQSKTGRVALFEIRVKGQLDERWREWLEGLEVKLLDNGEMLLFGRIVDQAALLGILNKLSRLNLSLVSLREIREDEAV